MTSCPMGRDSVLLSMSHVRSKLMWASLFAGLLVTNEVALGTSSSTRIHQGAPPVAFEVASIKLASPVPTRLTLVMNSREFRHSNISLEGLIQLAYQVPRSRGDVVVGGPGWLRSQKFSVVAKYPGGATFDQLPAMLREFLAGRFKLLLHGEKREGNFLMLTLSRRDGQLGSKIRRSSDHCSKIGPDSLLPSGEWPFCGTRERSRGDGGRERTYTAGFQEMSVLVDHLARVLGEPVQDGTGLAGKFDYDLTYSLEPLRADSPSVSEAPTIFSALQEQLGLKLESVRGPVDVLVIDRVDLPDLD